MANGNEGKVDDSTKSALVAYLLVWMLLMVYLVYTLWAAEPKPAAAVVSPAVQQSTALESGGSPPAPAKSSPDTGTGSDPGGEGASQKTVPQQPPAATSTAPAAGQPAPPTISSVEPATITVGSGQASISVHGTGFEIDSMVTLNGVLHKPELVNERHLVAPLMMTDLAVPGPRVVRVTGKRGISNGATLTVIAASSIPVAWKILGYEFSAINQDIRLILLVLFTGALGACVAGLQSLADYIGNDRLKSSWVQFYIVRPPIGAGVAFVFYLVIRGGLASGAGFDAGNVNPFGLTAIAALVGMFSDKAMLKLGEVFTTLFKADDTRRDKLRIFDIATAERLPDATAGTLYSHKLEVTGGASPFTWTAETALPAWLGLDGAKGELSGTPTAAKDETFTIRVKDANGTTAKREFKLKVN